jgi:hypothetical protein
MDQAADAAIAVVLRLGGENASRALDPEHATRRNGSRATIGRCRWHGALEALDARRSIAAEGDRDRRNRESQQILQIEVPALKASLRNVPILPIG